MTTGPGSDGMQTVRKAPARRKRTKVPRDAGAEAFLAVHRAEIDQIDLKPLFDTAADDYNSMRDGSVSRGRGNAVLYSQAEHDAVKGMFGEARMQIAALQGTVATLFGRVLELEAADRSKSALQYRGVFQMGETYSAGNFVTQDGSLWHANESTTARPGGGEAAWTLAVKRGANGRDVR